MRPLYVAFLWHHHQPFYKDTLTGQYLLPWVRMHAIKDYLDTVKILDQYPEIHQTFNIVPSLIRQLNDYSSGEARDVFFDLSRKQAATLDPDDKYFILKNFFMANWETMVKKHKYYWSLLEKRGLYISNEELRENVKFFSSQEFLDIQTWFNLAWFDPVYLEQDEALGAMVAKGKLFTEENKNMILDKQIDIIKRVLPAYKEAQDRGQIELSTSPFYHPILPLLVDTQFATRALPGIALPKNRFRHPEDAREQLLMAKELYETTFGRSPVGLWPSEGSVCEEIVPIISELGFKWAASDEEILSLSLGLPIQRDMNGAVLEPELLYSPYEITVNGKPLKMVFRDHFLSDLIGFTYSRWRPEDAASNLVTRLKDIQKNGSKTGSNHLVSIILDGENAWEYYQEDGNTFMHALYSQLSRERELLKTVTLSEFLDQNRPLNLPRLFSGSWINHNFRIWIGHEEDNLSWDALSEAKNALDAYSASPAGRENKENVLKAREELYISEGSDWNWWYGDDHSSPNDDDFDYLYRKHLSNIYELIGQPIPVNLSTPILRKDIVRHPAIRPSALLKPKLDGMVSHFYEWMGAGRCVDTSVDTMHQSEKCLTDIYYGFDLQTLYIRIDGKLDMILDAEIVLNVVNSRNYKLIFMLKEDKVLMSAYKEEQNNWKEISYNPDLLKAVKGKIIEISIPLETIGIQKKEKFSVYFQLKGKGNLIERWPGRGSLDMEAPGDDFDETSWKT